ncbi:hypothetical protein GCM10027566_11330 [Arachidicoccus ginsenosidivorans]|jgi:NAD(P)H-dependent FMN reductase|uniref:NADPH-dependent FMN reductase-like domain-containing protein n=1 Tax=Arachidicoccus ginsenosidivorans TaxID=496057 RepID=A0A5B8VH88_9BACT|nr:NAD(P)H-dependent oxidoreductase [Arachidicoccus ginsenosidivorans]QEC70533.1 hypothetical protein FSB73_01230 [Arachidicoccus ginsenosidivorans]
MRHLQILALIGSTKDHSSNYKLVKFLKGLAMQPGFGESQKQRTPSTDKTKDQQAKLSSEALIHWNTFPISGLPFFDPDLDKSSAGTDTLDALSTPQYINDPNRDLDQHPRFEKRSDAGVPGSRVPTVVQQLREKVADADAVIICSPEYVFSLPGILKNALEWLVATTVLSDKPMALIIAAASGDKAKESLELIVKTLGGKFTDQTSIRIRGIAGKFDSSGQLIDPETIASLQQLLFALKELILADFKEEKLI